MYLRKWSTHGIPALKLCRSPCTWQMIKTVFLGITSSHPCFLVECESFPSSQCCYRSECSVLWGLPTTVLSEDSSILWNFFCMQAKPCGFCAHIKYKLSTRTIYWLFLISLPFTGNFKFFTVAVLFFIQLFMQIEALFPRRFGTWNEYAKKYCDARVRYYCLCLFTFLGASLTFLVMPSERISSLYCSVTPSCFEIQGQQPSPPSKSIEKRMILIKLIHKCC